MPIFEYRCEKCGKVTEVLERPGSKPRHTCPACGSRRMAKLFSAFGLGKGGSCTPSPSGFA